MVVVVIQKRVSRPPSTTTLVDPIAKAFSNPVYSQADVPPMFTIYDNEVLGVTEPQNYESICDEVMEGRLGADEA